MKNAIFARPNLKVFLLGAMLIVVVQALVGGDEQDDAIPGVFGSSPVVSWTGNIDELMEEASTHPSSSVFLRISHYYEKQRDYKKAIHYLQRAEKLARLEELHQ
jgi:hypothetical protein